MTDEDCTDELKEKAKKYFEDSKDYYDSREPITDRQLRQIFYDGYEQGYEDCRRYAYNHYKPRWHSLEENLDDLPDWNKPILIKLKNGQYITNNIFAISRDFKFDKKDIDSWKEIR